MGEFFMEVLHRSDGKNHFQGKDSAILTVALYRKFFLYLASSRHGKLEDVNRPNPETTPPRYTLVTMEAYFGILYGTLKYHAISLKTEVRQQIL